MRVVAILATVTIFWFASVLVCQGKPSTSAKCVDPTPDAPEWWKITWHPKSDGSATGTTPRPPELPRDLKIDRWAGRYRLLVIATAGTVQRDTISATITLWVPREPTRLQSALVGVTDSNFTFTYGAALAHPTWQRDPRRPGISLLYGRSNGEITLVFGNGDLQTTDSGVLFEIFTIDDEHMGGRWVDGGLGVLVDSAGHSQGHPQGYFCLHRIS